MKPIILMAVLLLFLVPAFGQNTIANWNGDLWWDAPAGPAPEGYNLYKSTTSGGPYAKVNTALISGLTFNDPTHAEGDYYAVAAVNSIGIEGLSEEIRIVDQSPPLFLRLFQVIARFFRWVFGGWA